MARKRPTRAERKARKRRAALGLVTDTRGEQGCPTSPADAENADSSVLMETTAEQHGVRGLLEDPGHIRSDLQLIERYYDDFDDEERKKIRRRMGEIIINGGDREAIRAMQVELMRAKVVAEIEGATSPPSTPSATGTEIHGDVNVNFEQRRTDVFTIASSLGLRIDTEGEGTPDGLPSEPEAIEGSAAVVPGETASGGPSEEERGE